jgi:hypothetical protein
LQVSNFVTIFKVFILLMDAVSCLSLPLRLKGCALAAPLSAAAPGPISSGYERQRVGLVIGGGTLAGDMYAG